MEEIALCNPAGLLATSDLAGAAEGTRDLSKGSIYWAERAVGAGRTEQPKVRAGRRPCSFLKCRRDRFLEDSSWTEVSEVRRR